MLIEVMHLQVDFLVSFVTAAREIADKPGFSPTFPFLVSRIVSLIFVTLPTSAYPTTSNRTVTCKHPISNGSIENNFVKQSELTDCAGTKITRH